MGKRTSAGYADHSFNFVRGCGHVSPGCDNCSGEATALKVGSGDVLGKWGGPLTGGVRVVAADSSWAEPLAWNRQAKANGVPLRVVTMTLGDVFEPWPGELRDHKGERLLVTPSGTWVTRLSGSPPKGVAWTPLTKDEVLERWLALVNGTPHLQWLVPTKFPEYIIPTLHRVANLPNSKDLAGSAVAGRWKDGFPPDNVWLGVSVENQQYLSQRVFYMRQVEARIRFVLAEPVLGPMDIKFWFNRAKLETDSFNWLVIGGEYGPEARKCETEWIKGMIDQAREVGIPVWVQAVGSNPFTPLGPTSKARLAVSDERGETPSDWPEEIRIRELPDLGRDR